ncbi:DUF418 domain-containing protein [Marinactinospora rubrisoli]|uniref:DUF418 domain-containing protein n=1 Tax=Marinactinospora rubrisoli TaxID=2715399 RepID=A0ABW2K9F4_9ACTN
MSVTVPAPSATGSAAPSTARLRFLDVARGWAMIGVVLMNTSYFVHQVPEPGLVTDLVDSAATLLFSNRARTLLMILLGIGVVLTWRSTVRRGGRPGPLLLRRYVALFVVFGLAHRAVFHGDILTHYALVALPLIALLPWLLAGRAWRPLALAAGCLPLGIAAGVVIPDAPFELALAPQTLTAFAAGVWLGRLLGDPELHAGPRARRAAVRVLLGGLAIAVAGLVTALAGQVVLGPRRFGADGVPLPPTVAESAVIFTGGTLLMMGGALLYFGLVWRLADGDGPVSRALGLLAPLGRMSLTVYLGSTVVFLLVETVLGAQTTPGVLFAAGLGYLVVMGIGCAYWLRAFRWGPAEWLWRVIGYLRPLPLRVASGR